MAWKSKPNPHRVRPPLPERTPSLESVQIVEPYPEQVESVMTETKTNSPLLGSYQDYIEIRELDIERTKGTSGFLKNEDIWFWVKTDNGAWTGPHQDWERSHRHKYFKKVKKFDVVITAGANLGMYTRFLAKKFQRVYAFEPEPLNFHCMVINNQVDNVYKMNAALGKEPGFVFTTGTRTASNRGMFKVNPEAAGAFIPMFSIDSLPWDTVDLIQLDVEGYEYDVLQGAKNTIQKHKPVVIAENGKKKEIEHFMNQLGYIQGDQSVSDTIYHHRSKKE